MNPTSPVDRHDPQPSNGGETTSVIASTSETVPVVDAREALPQVYGHLVRLVGQVNQMQAQLAQLLVETQHNGAQLGALTNRVTDPGMNRAADERMGDLLTRLEGAEGQLEELASNVQKLSRTLFKATALGESREQQVAEALSILRELSTRREQVESHRLTHEQVQQEEIRVQMRGEIAADFLPVLDGIEAALESGHALLARRGAPPSANESWSAPPTARFGLFDRLRYAWGGELPSTVIERPVLEDEAALVAWLEGLELVRERFLALLAAEGIRPIEALNQPFDPRLHVAVEAVQREDVPGGTVVGVLRRGYRQRDRILRYAEVVVTKTTHA